MQPGRTRCPTRHGLATHDSKVIGNDYKVLGTVESKTWKAGITGGQTTGAMMDHLSEFKKHLTLDLDSGGWRPADVDPEQFVIPHATAESRRKTPWAEGRNKSA
ncbi:MAG: hypothetical protein JWO87_1289 [Phycisphaerales bacterium]|nr:hypothetical protein [Phycisphaerales bacterium]